MKLHFLRTSLAASACALALASAVPSKAHAEATLSGFLGVSFSPHAGVDYDLGNGTTGRVTSKWDAENFEAPPYYGVRATWWLEQMPEIGLMVDFTHAKAAADPVPAPFTTLEFTDGINFLTGNVLYRYQTESRFTPYAGVGVGLAIPYVEVTVPGVTNTRDYQVTGVAVQGLIGVDAKITDDWSIFGEYKAGYADVNADLDNGGSIDTHVVSHQFLIGLTYKLF
ncbi:MAG: outer membrane beta-barrel protein [Ahrensia sp.]|nr:outer membrane beta-barrel protein [Ahrensia sp.]